MSAYKNGYPPTSCVNFSIALIAETASYLKKKIDFSKMKLKILSFKNFGLKKAKFYVFILKLIVNFHY